MTGRALSERDYRTLAAFRKRLRQFLAFSEAAARDIGLTPNQHQLLLAIRGHPGPDKPSISDTADALCLQLHSTTELVGRAVEASSSANATPPTHDASCSPSPTRANADSPRSATSAATNYNDSAPG